MRVLIIDGYTDEPAGLGVPPYMDVYPRYIAGAAWSLDPLTDIRYITIDEARRNPSRVSSESSSSDIAILIAGVTVPGKYLGGAPATLNDALSLPKIMGSKRRAICGPAMRFGFGKGGGSRTFIPQDLNNLYDFVITGDPETVVFDLISSGFDESTDLEAERASENSINEFAKRGARIASMHPCFPGGLICELESYRGCARSLGGGCSFCTEPLHGLPDFRSVKGIANEVGALCSAGIVNFRLGRQPDLLVYGAKNIDTSLPEPNPQAIRRLLSAVRKAAPTLRVLHIDNVNPATLSTHPVPSEKALKAIVEHHTPGDVAALGIESVDEAVILKNNLKVDYDGAMAAVALINKVGSTRGENGLPHLLPGINFVYGLPGETESTFEANYEFMKDILDRGLMVRRINLRQVMVMPSTRMESSGDYLMRKHKSLFIKHKLKMRQGIDLPMLARVVPQWTVLRDLRTELVEGKMTWCRQIGSYPILVGIPSPLPVGETLDAIVLSHGPRSVGALPVPLRINSMSMREIEAIPGIGSKRAAAILRGRPYASASALRRAVDDPSVIESLIPFLAFP
jgi:radical SAM superfamily enzyme with C-terminal helix-hairpin-helix motif